MFCHLGNVTFSRICFFYGSVLAVAEKKDQKEESEESDDNMGFDLFN